MLHHNNLKNFYSLDVSHHSKMDVKKLANNEHSY